MAVTNVEPIHPTEVKYRDHNIILTHRPRINDWHYTITHTQVLTLNNHAPRYDVALKQAQHDIDILLGGKP